MNEHGTVLGPPIPQVIQGKVYVGDRDADFHSPSLVPSSLFGFPSKKRTGDEATIHLTLNGAHPERCIIHWKRSSQSSSGGFFAPEVFLKAFLAATRGADSFKLEGCLALPSPGYHLIGPCIS